MYKYIQIGIAISLRLQKEYQAHCFSNIFHEMIILKGLYTGHKLCYSNRFHPTQGCRTPLVNTIWASRKQRDMGFRSRRFHVLGSLQEQFQLVASIPM